jgi:hypothetical protein
MRLILAPTPALRTVPEVAAIVGRSRRAVGDWCKRGLLPAEWDARLRRHLVAQDDLDAFIAAGGPAAMTAKALAARPASRAAAARADSRADVARLLADYHATRRKDLLRLATAAVADHIKTHREHPLALGHRWYILAGELAKYRAAGAPEGAAS